MNWLAQYFEQRTSRLTLSLWAYPPLVIGPDGPIAKPAFALGYPGAELVYSPGAVIQQAGRTYTLPPRFDMNAERVETMSVPPARDDAHAAFFKRVSIFAPSTFNPEFLVTINDTLSFVPGFAADGSPVFFGVAQASSGEPMKGAQALLPWVFRGYISI